MQIAEVSMSSPTCSDTLVTCWHSHSLLLNVGLFSVEQVINAKMKIKERLKGIQWRIQPIILIWSGTKIDDRLITSLSLLPSTFIQT